MLSPARPWYMVLGTGVVAVIGGVAILLGWLGTRDRTARLALVLGPLVLFVLFLAPGTLHLIDAFAASQSIIWRAMWVVPVPAMIGLLATAGWLPDVHASVRTAGWLGASALVVVLLATGYPVWSEANGAHLGRPAWDVAPASLAAARHIIPLARPHTVIAAPVDVGGAIAIQTTKVKASLPRERYLHGRWAVTAFHRAARGLLTRAVSAGDVPMASVPDVRNALHQLGVTAACVDPRLAGTAGEVALRDEGFRLVGEDATCRYWKAGT
jgi:hypothetical protein